MASTFWHLGSKLTAGMMDLGLHRLGVSMNQDINEARDTGVMKMTTSQAERHQLMPVSSAAKQVTSCETAQSYTRPNRGDIMNSPRTTTIVIGMRDLARSARATVSAGRSEAIQHIGYTASTLSPVANHALLDTDRTLPATHAGIAVSRQSPTRIGGGGHAQGRSRIPRNVAVIADMAATLVHRGAMVLRAPPEISREPILAVVYRGFACCRGAGQRRVDSH